MDDVIELQAVKLNIPRRLTATMKEIWSLQPRFDQRSGKRPFTVLAHPRFRAAYDFLLLRAESGETPAELGGWWRRFVEADPEHRRDLLQPAGEGEQKKRRRRGRRKGAASSPGGTPATTPQAS
jgi:poly(A) polymerase